MYICIYTYIYVDGMRCFLYTAADASSASECMKKNNTHTHIIILYYIHQRRTGGAAERNTRRPGVVATTKAAAARKTEIFFNRTRQNVPRDTSRQVRVNGVRRVWWCSFHVMK